MPERSSSIRMSRRSSLAGFRRSVTENPETSELLPTQWERGLDAICILVGPKMSDPPLEGGVVWILSLSMHNYAENACYTLFYFPFSSLRGYNRKIVENAPVEGSILTC